MFTQGSPSRTRRARGGTAAIVGALLAVASLVAVAPAGASNQSVRFSVTEISFGNVDVGTSTTGQAIVTNDSTAPLVLTSISPSSTGGEFSATAGSCTAALGPNDSCDVDAVFAPTTAGARASTLSVTMSEETAQGQVTASSTVDAALVGDGVMPTFTLTGSNAGRVTLGTTGTLEAAIVNTSYVALSVKSDTLASNADGEFSITSTACPSSLLPGGDCGIEATFTPHVVGDATATLSVTMQLEGSSAVVTDEAVLEGDGVTTGDVRPPFAVEPVTFGHVTVGTSSTSFAVLTNVTKHDETLDGASISSDATNSFATTGNDCPSALAPGASCDITVVFSPDAAKTLTASLAVTVTYLDARLTGVRSTEQTSLTGIGIHPTFTLAGASFPPTLVGRAALGLVVVTNTSDVPLGPGLMGFKGADAGSWSVAGISCIGNIKPGGSCGIEVRFAPRAQGTLAITFDVTLDLRVRSSNTFTEEHLALVGHGVLPAFKVAVPSLTSAHKGVAVAGTVRITNESVEPLSFDGFQLIGADPADFAVTGSTCSAPLAPEQGCALSVRFTPSLAAAGTETAVLKVIMAIPGMSPQITTAKDVTITGTES